MPCVHISEEQEGQKWLVLSSTSPGGLVPSRVTDPGNCPEIRVGQGPCGDLGWGKVMHVLFLLVPSQPQLG